jgi:copper chaperone
MKLSIPDMSCGHCKAVVEKTIIDLDSGADVAVDLASRTAKVTTSLSEGAILNALSAEGYPATVQG